VFQTLDDAIKLAEFAHRHQFDLSGFNYVEHPKRVLATVQAQGAPPYVQMAAVLHDIAEDTPFTPDVLSRLGFSEAVLVLVELLSRKLYGIPGSKKPDDGYYADIRSNYFARMIKLADIADNTLEWRLTYLSEERQTKLRNKYAHALEALGV
jgi:(p)ppGpp synthase/HD superfamily hydrolase